MQKTNVTKTKLKVAARGKKQSARQHILASLFPIAEHKHTGKRLHHEHTSHGVLLIILFLTGVILFSNLGVLKVFSITSSGQISIGLTVNGAPPSIGAAITSPTPASTVRKAPLAVEGLCPQSTLVAIYNNGTFAGSTICTPSDLFQLTIYPKLGVNILQAQNYDDLNQPGPITAQVLITYQIPNESATSDSPEINSYPTQKQVSDVIINPAPQPAKNPCYESTSIKNAKQSGLDILLPCIIRNVYIGETLQLPLTIVGGISPYALSIDWGDDAVDLKSLPSAGKQTLEHTYGVPNIKSLKINLTDSSGASSSIQTVVAVNGGTIPSTNTTSAAIANLQKIWVEAPVPLYIAAVTLTLGFWVGDLFDRFFGGKSPQKMRRHA